jgi:hypothetical protein
MVKIFNNSAIFLKELLSMIPDPSVLLLQIEPLLMYLVAFTFDSDRPVLMPLRLFHALDTIIGLEFVVSAGIIFTEKEFSFSRLATGT